MPDHSFDQDIFILKSAILFGPTSHAAEKGLGTEEMLPRSRYYSKNRTGRCRQHRSYRHRPAEIKREVGNLCWPRIS